MSLYRSVFLACITFLTANLLECCIQTLGDFVSLVVANLKIYLHRIKFDLDDQRYNSVYTNALQSRLVRFRGTSLSGKFCEHVFINCKPLNFSSVKSDPTEVSCYGKYNICCTRKDKDTVKRQERKGKAIPIFYLRTSISML